MTFKVQEELIGCINDRDFPDGLTDWQKDNIRGMYWAVEAISDAMPDYEIYDDESVIEKMVSEVSLNALEDAIQRVELNILQTMASFLDNNALVEEGDEDEV